MESKGFSWDAIIRKVNYIVGHLGLQVNRGFYSNDTMTEMSFMVDPEFISIDFSEMKSEGQLFILDKIEN